MADICDRCMEYEQDNCIKCRFGNPCLGCDDYDEVNDVCLSCGGCGADMK